MLVTLFLLGFGGSQLFYGALSDAVGRRPTFLLGQGIYLIGTIVCVMMSNHFQALEFGRLLQGLVEALLRLGVAYYATAMMVSISLKHSPICRLLRQSCRLLRQCSGAGWPII